jgi:hypothetical protein
MKMQEITVIDAIMGSGKTHDAIESMKKNKGKFIYVTPFLNEVERIIDSVPDVEQPIINYDYDDDSGKYLPIYKRDNLLRMANRGINLATTHSLFQNLHKTDYTHFIDYDLILDEVITPIKVLGISSDDIKIAINEGLIVVNENNGEVTYTGDEYNGKYYAELKRYCDTVNVIYINERLLVWAFPPDLFRNFKSVTVLTYLFEGSLLCAYFDFYNISYKIRTNSFSKEAMVKKNIKSLLNIYVGKCNDIGNRNNAFCVNWLNKRTSRDYQKIKSIVANLLNRKFKTTSGNAAYTTFKKFKAKLKGKGYSKGFIPVNERATNIYSHKESMIYLANRFINPEIKEFFNSGKIEVNEDKWALSELLQWIFRGRIRKNLSMNLYIPSKRMRTLLIEWLKEHESI